MCLNFMFIWTVYSQYPAALCYYLQVTKLKILDTLGFTGSKRPGSLKLFIEKSEIRLIG